MECKKCKKNFLRRIVIAGRTRNLNNRKYCLDCSPFKMHNTKRLHLREKQTFKVCKECKRQFPRARHQHKHVCGSCYASLFRVRLKKELVEIFGGCCKVCGYSKCIWALEFHHLDPTKKELQISGCTRSKKKLIEEAEKCLLVCNRCHREIHSGVVQWQNDRLLSDKS